MNKHNVVKVWCNGYFKHEKATVPAPPPVNAKAGRE